MRNRCLNWFSGMFWRLLAVAMLGSAFGIDSVFVQGFVGSVCGSRFALAGWLLITMWCLLSQGCMYHFLSLLVYASLVSHNRYKCCCLLYSLSVAVHSDRGC